jgi:circadian clock protein KaiB
MKGSAQKSPEKAKAPETGMEKWLFRLYVEGETLGSLAALANLKKICAGHLGGRCRIEVIDLLVQPELAKDDQVLAAPTLVRKLPEPEKRIIGDLPDTKRLLEWLEVPPMPAPANVWRDE